MPERLFKFTPALEDPKVLQATSVGREKELKRILRAIKEGTKRKGGQHFLLVGPRGIGKTHLLLLVYHSVKGTIAWDEMCRDLKLFWVPILFSEEEYRITSLVDLLVEILIQLKDETPYEELLHLTTRLDRVQLPGNAEKELALDYLLKWRDETGKKILLLLDNLHDILPHFSEEDQGRLRDILMSEDLLMLIGTAPTLFETVVDHTAPFYNFFEVVWLREVNEEEIKQLIAKRLKLDGRDNLLEKLDEYEHRLKAIVHLTGGNPRLILSLYEILTKFNIIEVERDITKLLDEMTPYFQDRMKELTVQQRKIIDALALAGGPVTPTEIARLARLQVNITNSQLNRLKKAGLVKATKERKKREVLYDVNDRLFRIWRQMRVEAGRKQLRFIIKFIEIWFSPKELTEQIIELGKQLTTFLTSGSLMGLKETIDKLYYLQQATQMPLRAIAHFQRFLGLVGAGDLTLAEQAVKEFEREAERETDEFLSLIISMERGILCGARKEWEAAVECLQSAVESKPPTVDDENWNQLVAPVYTLLGMAYIERDELNEAIKTFSRAIKLGRELSSALEASALVGRSRAFILKDSYFASLKDADKAYRIATKAEAEPLVKIAAIMSIGTSLVLSVKNVAKKRDERALEYLQKAVKFIPNAIPQDLHEPFGIYFKALLLKKDPGFMKRALEIIEGCGQTDLLEFLKPYRVALQYLEKKDKGILNRMVPETRKIIEEILDRLEESN